LGEHREPPAHRRVRVERAPNALGFGRRQLVQPVLLEREVRHVSEALIHE
jgi:hypothetical protein